MQNTRHITILSASETGNSRGVAEDLLASIQAIFSNVRLVDSIDYEFETEFATEDILIMVTSTQGEGEPPFEAEYLYDYIMGNDAPKLTAMKFAVLGLGDSAYGESYNLMARQFDARYEQLGAQRIMKHGECDFDYELAAQQWIQQLMPVLQKELGLAQGVPQTQEVSHTQDAELNDSNVSQNPDSKESQSKKPVSAGNAKSGGLQEFDAVIEERRLLTSQTSEKQVYGIRLRPESADISFQPGDMVTLQYPNADATVARLLHHAFGEKAEHVDERIIQILQSSKDISRNTPALIERYTQFAPDSPFAGLATDNRLLRDYAQTHPPYALFDDFPAQITPDQMLSLFTSSNRRLYSISNAAQVSSGYIELTVSKVQYSFRNEHIAGECSDYITSVPLGTHVTMSVLSNKRFRLPENHAEDIIMIGLGSAVAPYRAFLQERALSVGEGGRNWLIAGNRNPEQDYLYGDEFEHYLDQGVLDSLDLAWSRYGDVREHVQNIVLRHAGKLYEWLESGAYVYLCGHDHVTIESIEQSIKRAVMLGGHMPQEQAQTYVEELQKNNRIHQ